MVPIVAGFWLQQEERIYRLRCVALLALLNFFWMRAGKNDFAEVAVYSAIVGVLLGWRVHHAWRRRHALRHAP